MAYEASTPLVPTPESSFELSADKKKKRRRAPEAHQLHGVRAHEHIGHMLITAEARPARPIRPAKIERPSTGLPQEILSDRRIETLNRTELMELSEQITVEGSSLRQIYETHLIGERGLRRLVAEHLRGGDLKKALRQEIVEREIDFERDPALRDMGAPITRGPSVLAGGTPALNKLIEKAAGMVGGSSEEMAFFKARANYESTQLDQQLKRRQLINASFASAILVLLVLIILLIITRG